MGEDLTETEIRLLHGHYQRLVTMAKHDVSLTESHSIEEAEERHRSKTRPRKPSVDRSSAAPPTVPCRPLTGPDGPTRPSRTPAAR